MAPDDAPASAPAREIASEIATAPGRPSAIATATGYGPPARSEGRLGRALATLYARVPLGMRLGLDAMREACVRAGHPEAAFEVAHIAGTNGKGSTSAMVEAMARAAGRRTGLYTSPHLCRFAERIRIDGEPLDDEVLTDVLERALAIGPELSFFETATLAAFLAFREHDVDLGVVEVGIGGRLDATNVVPPPRCAAITRVALDHVDRLGPTLEGIAREKAGIAKPGTPLVLGPLPDAVREAAVDVALAAGAPVVDADGSVPAEVLAELGLRGDYQRDNARVAWRIASELGIDEAARRSGLGRARWPGRFERLEATGVLIGPYLLDGAHNPDGASALARALGREAPAALVFGALADKAWPEMLDVLANVPCPRVYTPPQGRAPAAPSEMAARAPGVAASSMGEALARARALAGPTGLVVVCGSLYLVGEARALLLGLPQDPPVAL